MRVWQSRNQNIWVWGKFCWGFQFANMVWSWFWVPLFHWVALDPRFPHVSEPGRHIKIHQSKQIKTVWVKWIEKLLQRQDTVGFPIFFFLNVGCFTMVSMSMTTALYLRFCCGMFELELLGSRRSLDDGSQWRVKWVTAIHVASHPSA